MTLMHVASVTQLGVQVARPDSSENRGAAATVGLEHSHLLPTDVKVAADVQH